MPPSFTPNDEHVQEESSSSTTTRRRQGGDSPMKQEATYEIKDAAAAVTRELQDTTATIKTQQPHFGEEREDTTTAPIHDSSDDDEGESHDDASPSLSPSPSPPLVEALATTKTTTTTTIHNNPTTAAEDSFPTPIISNRGCLLETTTPWMIPSMQLPASAVEQQQQPPPQARFSSFHEPPITCNWPTRQRQTQSSPSSSSLTTTTTTSTAVPPEICIPLVPNQGLPFSLRTRYNTAAITNNNNNNNNDNNHTAALVAASPIIGGLWTTMTQGGAGVRFLWHVMRAARAGTLAFPPAFFRNQKGKHGVCTTTTSPATTGQGQARTTCTTTKLRDMIAPLSSSAHKKNTTTTTTTSMGDERICGLPSFGQTCFMNATLQSLASMEAFGVYLQHVVYLVEQQQTCWSSDTAMTNHGLHEDNYDDDDDDDDKDNDVSAEKVSRLLLDCLQSVNGIMAPCSFVDTRPLLREIGLRHAQFRTMGSEQQDAQEFLTALLDSIVTEAKITSGSFVCPNSFVGLPEATSSPLSLLWHEQDEEDVLTVVSGCKERQRQRQKHMVDGSYCNNGDGHMLLTTNVHISTTTRTMSDYSSMGQIPVASNHSTTLSSSNEDTTHHATRHLHNGVYVRPEEKKQEDFELHIPKVASEEELLTNNLQRPPVHHIMDPSHTMIMMDDHSLSDVSSKEQQRPVLSTSLEIMRTTTTPLSPSPLTGWMGSSLQCRQCGHVRPIRNSPFGDWSVTPTAIADGWLQTGDKNHHGPCRLQDCLAEYVRVERVDDVECRACTIKHERAKMLEEIEMTEGVIAGLLAKTQRRRQQQQRETATPSQVVETATGDEHYTALKQELFTYRCELTRLDQLDADDDTQRIFVSTTNPNDGQQQQDAEGHRPSLLLRGSALKCMFLTRLPAILCIHIQRRFYNPVSDRMIKVTQPVVFPEILDVAPYCAYGGGVLGGNWAGSRKNAKNHQHAQGTTTTTAATVNNHSIPYRLQAVMEHRGGAFSGHYVCFRRDTKANGGWLFISDDTVRRVSWEQVQRSQAYMLFYEAL